MRKRRIEFRGIDVSTNNWVYGQLAYLFDNRDNPVIMKSNTFVTRDFGGEDDNGEPIFEEALALGGFVKVRPETVSEYIGLEDTNGHPIFEGDVIIYLIPQGDGTLLASKPMVVTFEKGKFGLRFISQDDKHHYDLPSHGMTIISDVHKEPLLDLFNIQ